MFFYEIFTPFYFEHLETLRLLFIPFTGDQSRRVTVDWLLLALSAALFIYLMWAVFVPEKF
ncbi:potassium-transporting ATPase subunit F [Photobacterium halotolerans]|nr:potassium-transporting ATPase subunit F [Photobacterium halotolerans]